MLRALRSRLACLVVSVALAAGTTAAAFSELLHADLQHDLACAGTVELGHDASSHGFDATPAQPGSGAHCLACHLARAPRLDAQPLSPAALVDESRPLRPVLSIGAARPSAWARVPGRSPPSLS